MYKSTKFEEKDSDKVLAFMQAHPFITLVGFDGDYPVATQVPVQVYRNGSAFTIVGHIMKKTDHHTAYSKNENVLAIFTGAHAYISASVYENPASASTWNYSTVQAKGKIRLMDRDETREVIKHLTDSYEDPKTSPAAFHRMTTEYIEQNLKAISGFEIIVTALENTFKLSQNHPQQNRAAIVDYLSQSKVANDQAVAQQMKENL